jgi:hypothetical protein
VRFGLNLSTLSMTKRKASNAVDVNLESHKRRATPVKEKKRSAAEEGEEVSCSLVNLPNGHVKVILASEYKDVLKRVGEDDPALLIAWDLLHVEHLVLRLNAAPPPTPWLGITAFPIDANQLVAAIAGHVAAMGGGNIGNCLIAPNSIDQYSDVHTALHFVGQDPYIVQLHNQAALNLPIGRLYMIADRKAQSTGVPHPGMQPPNGVRLFQ